MLIGMEQSISTVHQVRGHHTYPYFGSFIAIIVLTTPFYSQSITARCANTVEIAFVFNHEWGHGLDYNDVTVGVSAPSGKGITGKMNSSWGVKNWDFGVDCLTRL